MTYDPKVDPVYIEMREHEAAHLHVTMEQLDALDARIIRHECGWKHGIIENVTVEEFGLIIRYLGWFTGAWAGTPGPRDRVVRGHGILARRQPDRTWKVEYIYVCEGGDYGHNGRIKDWCGKAFLY